MTKIFIHPSANISNDAIIGDGSKIWINVQIREHTEIGLDCIISKDVYIDHSVKIGDRCKVQNSVSIYNGVTLEDDVFIGPNVAFTNDKIPRAFNTNWTTTPTIVKRGASIGANATIICGITIGEYAMVAAGSVVTKSVPDNVLVVGNPSRFVSYICKCGNRLDKNYICKICGELSQIANTRDAK
jgi:acetyltransferase-like isoleucine patch superfamily enzyme